MLSAIIAMLLLSVQGGGAQPAAQTPAPAAAEEDPDQVICRQSEPVLGSRIARRRICRTRAQWRTFNDDRSQLRRDLQNSGSCGTAASCTSD
ncbi:MAG TPA: hypothetical protein VGB08_07970 [Allosphingosinicella sp.]